MNPALSLPLVKNREMMDASVPKMKKSYHSKAVPAEEAATSRMGLTSAGGCPSTPAIAQRFDLSSGDRVSLMMRQLFMSAMNSVSSDGQAIACAQLNCPSRRPEEPSMPRIFPSSVIL